MYGGDFIFILLFTIGKNAISIIYFNIT